MFRRARWSATGGLRGRGCTKPWLPGTRFPLNAMPSSERVAQLFQDALEQPVEERARFLAEKCSGDGALLAEVESLLSSDGDASAAKFWSGSAIDVEAMNFVQEHDARRSEE